MYFNCGVRPGYTKRPLTEQITVFQCSLEAMDKLKPDIILIACNTLSVIYAETAHSKSVQVGLRQFGQKKNE